jgi:hypothetical protein
MTPPIPHHQHCMHFLINRGIFFKGPLNYPQREKWSTKSHFNLKIP